MRTIGLMSGTSLDGVDAAWLETDGERIAAFGPTLTLPYDDRLRADLRRILGLAPTLDPADRRHGYAFTTCTDCGPRLTILTALPYDRARTTMAGFPLCAACAARPKK